jgi:hypothetical protein
VSRVLAARLRATSTEPMPRPGGRESQLKAPRHIAQRRSRVILTMTMKARPGYPGSPRFAFSVARKRAPTSSNKRPRDDRPVNLVERSPKKFLFAQVSYILEFNSGVSLIYFGLFDACGLTYVE